MGAWLWRGGGVERGSLQIGGAGLSAVEGEMAVGARPPAGHAATAQQRKGRKVLYGEVGVAGEGGVDGGLHHKEWNARALGSGRMTSRSGRSTTPVVDHGAVYGEELRRGGLGGWCGGCMTRSEAVSPPPRGGARAKAEKVARGEAMGSLMKSFSGSLERASTPPGSSPAFRPRMSPGKVSPLVEVVPPPAVQRTEREREPREPREGQGVATAMAPAGFSMANYASMVGVSSSPPVEKIKASPTLFEMMTHEQELQGAKAVNTLSLSQQLTFQEKMKSILAGSLLASPNSTTCRQCRSLPPIFHSFFLKPFHGPRCPAQLENAWLTCQVQLWLMAWKNVQA